jgi:hypothetical protein
VYLDRRVSYDEGGGRFKWGDEIKPGTEADTIFGMYAPYCCETFRAISSTKWSLLSLGYCILTSVYRRVPEAGNFDIPVQPMREVLEELYRKRGRNGYYLRWSLRRDPQSGSNRSIKLFLHAVESRILQVLERTYSAG